jgi:ribosomal peptide maturation radical SAM protein 1
MLSAYDSSVEPVFEVALEGNRAFVVRRGDGRVVAGLDRLEAVVLKLWAGHSPDETRLILATAAGDTAAGILEHVEHRFGALMKHGRGISVPLSFDRLMKIDQRGRSLGLRDLPGPRVLHWTVTRYCPRKCIYCYAEPLAGGQALDSVIERAELASIFEEAASLGAEHFVVSGSEPFLRPDLPEIMGDALRCGITPFVTTKHRINKDLARRLAQAGMQHISISFEAVSEELSFEMVGSRQYPAQVRQSTASLREAGLQFSIQAVATRFNLRGLEDVAQFASDSGALVLQIVPFESVREPLTGHGNSDMAVADQEELRTEVDRISRQHPNLRVEFFDKSEGGAGFHCDIGMTKMFFLPDGTVHRCYKLAHDARLSGKNLRNCSVAEAWHDTSFGLIISPPRKSYGETGCSTCGRFDVCHDDGRCIYEASANWNSYYAPDRALWGTVSSTSRRTGFHCLSAMNERPIILVSMPWATVLRPSLSLGILSAIARSRGFPCEVMYANLLFSCLAGLQSYEYFADTPAFFGVAEHIFATQLFGRDRLSSDDYLQQMSRPRLQGSKESPPISFEHLACLRDLVPKFLKLTARELLSRNPRAVGFTCTFNQVMPSVALAKLLREADPSIEILLGGPCVHGEMGVCYSRIFRDYVNTVFLGEADEVLPLYLDQLYSNQPYQDVPGLAIGGHRTPDAPLFQDLDALPLPDYSDYFASRRELENADFQMGRVHSLPFEASRGCWWGQKHHCTFCGLNTEGMGYRRKTAETVAREVSELSLRYETRDLMAADNILDFRGYRDLLPTLAALPERPNLFFEMKANVSRDDVARLAAAGVVWVQPGFESFSDHVLHLMKKGTTALQNVSTLKWLFEFGIRISYNLLVGFPGETDEDFEDILRIIGKLHHLPPPGPEAHIVQIQRFAPFHFASQELGIGPIRASDFYARLIPAEICAPEEYAYFFERQNPDGAPVLRHLDRMNLMLTAWCASNGRMALAMGEGDLTLILSDGSASSNFSLNTLESAVLVLADQAISFNSLVARLNHLSVLEEIQATVMSLERRGLLLSHASDLLTVVPFSRPVDAASLRRWLHRSVDARGDAGENRLRIVTA